MKPLGLEPSQFVINNPLCFIQIQRMRTNCANRVVCICLNDAVLALFAIEYDISFTTLSFLLLLYTQFKGFIVDIFQDRLRILKLFHSLLSGSETNHKKHRQKRFLISLPFVKLLINESLHKQRRQAFSRDPLCTNWYVICPR